MQLPSLRAVGTFDPAKLPGFSPLSRLPQETYNPPVAAPANARTKRLLHGQDLLPNGNFAGYLQTPPLMLTDLNSISAFTNHSVFPDPTHARRSAPFACAWPTSTTTTRSAASGSASSRSGSSRTHIYRSTSPPAPHQRRCGSIFPATARTPALQLTEGWVEKGVAEAILSALDKQSVVLFVLILVVCALFVYNAAAAGVQARRVQLGVLQSLGWNDRELFALIVGEQATVGIVAGIIGAAIATPISRAAGFHPSIAHALLAIPAAVVLAVLAAAIPAVRAARAAPAAALRPPVLPAGHGWHARSVGQLALINVARAPVRSLLAVISLALGVGALTVLLATTDVFHNTLTGSLLGSAISLQVRGSDYAAVVVIVVLATAGIADVLYLNTRERAAELATLQATGWSDAALIRLVCAEALWLGLAGSLSGAALGILGTSIFAGVLPHSLIVVAILAAAVGTIVAALAALAPTIAITRLATVPILAAE